MRRRPLITLGESLARKKQVRQGWVYIKRPSGGLPQADDEDQKKLDGLIRDIAVNFDFSPIMSGDKVQAQQVADDFVDELRDRIKAEGLPSVKLELQVSRLWPHLWRSLNAFRDRLKTASKVS